MLENYLVRGRLIGLIFGVPAGSIGALTIQRTLNGGFAAGLSTGLGSSAADLSLFFKNNIKRAFVKGDFTQKMKSPTQIGIYRYPRFLASFNNFG